MGQKSSAPVPVDMATALEARGGGGGGGNIPDRSLSSAISTPEEDAAKRKRYAHIKPQRRTSKAGVNTIEEVYNDDFETIDHIQAVRFPPIVARQLQGALRGECERRCMDAEKSMARCLQDKMWTSWKCQKLRDAYFHCVEDEERRSQAPGGVLPDEGAAGADAASSGTDALSAYRWKYNLGVFHSELIGRNNLMRKIWSDHFPERELPHPWVSDDYK